MLPLEVMKQPVVSLKFASKRNKFGFNLSKDFGKSAQKSLAIYLVEAPQNTKYLTPAAKAVESVMGLYWVDFSFIGIETAYQT